MTDIINIYKNKYNKVSFIYTPYEIEKLTVKELEDIQGFLCFFIQMIGNRKDKVKNELPEFQTSKE